MGIVDIFSKRQKVLRGEMPDVYTYDQIPVPLKVQVVHIWRDALGDERAYQNEFLRVEWAYQFVVKTLCREYGLFVLPGNESYGRGRNYLTELTSFLLHEQDPERALDAIELSFRLIDTATRQWPYLHRDNCDEIANNAIAELNSRFREHSVGYEFDGEIIRVDSRLLHAETVKPTLALLRELEYKGAQEEFLNAHEHYRHGRKKEALNESLKALESVMKSICAKRDWARDPNAPAKTLLQTLFENGLIPAYWNAHFSALRSTLETGVPTARNKLGGHGQGPEVVEVPEFIVGYVLHLTASAIVFFVAAEKALP
jgi:hypothetical protein